MSYMTTIESLFAKNILATLLKTSKENTCGKLYPHTFKKFKDH